MLGSQQERSRERRRAAQEVVVKGLRASSFVAALPINVARIFKRARAGGRGLGGNGAGDGSDDGGGARGDGGVTDAGSSGDIRGNGGDSGAESVRCNVDGTISPGRIDVDHRASPMSDQLYQLEEDAGNNNHDSDSEDYYRSRSATTHTQAGALTDHSDSTEMDVLSVEALLFRV